MPSTVTKTTIANRALQILGYQPIGSLNDNDRGARAVNRAYYPVLYSELRKNFWGFAIKRAQISASATTPLFGKAYYYPLPVDYLDLCEDDQQNVYNFGSISDGSAMPTDYQIENFGENGDTLAIASNIAGPIQIRYISSAVTEAIFDSIFAEAFAAAIAENICEELTNSNAKIQTAAKFYDDAIEIAKKRNAFERKPVQPPTDTYILSRM